MLVQSNGSYSTLSPVVHGDIVLSINTNTIQASQNVIAATSSTIVQA